MSENNFEDLLKRMPEIAEAVNGFTSEEIQQQAFTALMRSAGVNVPAVEAPEEQDRREDDTEQASSARATRSSKPKGASQSTSRPKKKSAVATPKIVADLNLRPSGKKSFRDFVAEKNPQNANDKNVVAVYYLKQVLGLPAIGVDHVFTCYRDMQGDWKLPNNPRNALQVTSSVAGYIGTTNMDDIQLHAAGTNRVEHDLPAPEKKK